MRTCFIIIFIAFTSLVYGQNPAIPLRDSIDAAFTTLNQDSITTGILLDRCLPQFDITQYGAINDTLTDFKAWRGIYRSMYLGAFNRNGFITNDSINKILQLNREADVIPVFILNYNYNSFKLYAVDSNLIYFSNKRFYDSSPQPESPYFTNKVFNACGAFKVSYAANAKFVFSSDYYFSNDAAQIDSLQCDFNDGAGLRTINFGDTVTINYGDLLTHTITVKIFSGGIVKGESSFLFKMSDICPDDYPHDIIGNIAGEIAYPPGDLSDEAKVSAKYTITYGYESDGITKHTSLQNPVLFVSGFDPGYQNYKTTADDCKYGRMGWIDIISGLNYNLEEGTIENWDPEFTYAPDFFDQLFLDGYDVIFLDFKDGTDYMQRNAYTLVHMIEWINEHKAPDADETVIIGASMGGQLVRYALTYMESNNVSHCSRLFIAFDSPAKGANVPLGLQSFAWFVHYISPEGSDGSKDSEFQLESLRAPAARQLLIPHFEGEYPSGIHSYRTDFYNELFAMDVDGYPDNIRKVAVANGNKTAQPQAGLSDGQKFLELEVDKLFGYALGQSYFSPGYLNDLGHNSVFYGKYKVLGLTVLDYDIIPPADADGFDTAPGSKQSRLTEMDDDFDDTGSEHFDVYKDYFCFVPSISALDIYTAELDFDIESEIFEDAPDSYYPFFAYYAPEDIDENHVQLSIAADDDAGNTAWSIEQINKNAYDLVTALPNISLGTTYNYGNAYKNIVHSLDINSGGLLQINGNYNTDYGDGSPAVAGSTFTVYTSACNNSIITINSGGILEIGDDNDPVDNNKGILEVLDGSAIYVNTGGILKIRRNSQLNLRSGAILYLEPGGVIEIEEGGFLAMDDGSQLKLNGGVLDLKDSNAQLKLFSGGEIIVAAGVDFTLDSEGFFEYYDDGIFTMLGSTGKFILAGDGDTDLKMRLQEDADFYLQTHDVDIYNCKLSFNDNALFRVEANNTSLDLVNYEDFSTSVKAKSAILADNIVSLDVYNCDFTGFSHPVKVENVTVCPEDVNVNLQYNTFTGMGNIAITATNVDRIYMNANSVTGSATAEGGVWLEGVTDATIENGNIQGFTGVDAAGVFLWNTARLVLDKATIKNNNYGVDMHASSIYMRNKATIKNNATGIYAFGGSDYGVSNPTGAMKKISVGDVGCGWIIQNTNYGILAQDMQLEIDQIIHDNADSEPGNPIPNRFDGNGIGIQACYEYYDADDLGDTEIMAEHNHWQTGGGPASGYLKGGFDEDTHNCTSITFSTACYLETKPNNCVCNYDDCADEDCAVQLTEEEITLRLAETSCNTTIPKLGGGGTVTIAQQFRTAYVKYLDGDYNYAYQNFNHLKNKVNQNYPQGLSKGVCNTLYKEAVMYVELCSLLATVHCQPPFYTERLADEYSGAEFDVALYPNPANTLFTIVTNTSGIIAYNVYDMQGSKVVAGNFQTQTDIAVTGWPSGIYLIYLRNETNGNSNNVKLAVE